jgi:four helix bundle protein
MTNSIKRFEDLEVWQKAVVFASEIYKISDEGKLKKDFDAKSQLRRAAFSISNNIAEGFEYNSTSEFLRFLKYAKGSAGEVRNQLVILFRIGYLEKVDYQKLTDNVIELSQHIANFIKYLKEFRKNLNKVNH